MIRRTDVMMFRLFSGNARCRAWMHWLREVVIFIMQSISRIYGRCKTSSRALPRARPSSLEPSDARQREIPAERLRAGPWLDTELDDVEAVLADVEAVLAHKSQLCGEKTAFCSVSGSAVLRAAPHFRRASRARRRRARARARRATPRPRLARRLALLSRLPARGGGARDRARLVRHRGGALFERGPEPPERPSDRGTCRRTFEFRESFEQFVLKLASTLNAN